MDSFNAKYNKIEAAFKDAYHHPVSVDPDSNLWEAGVMRDIRRLAFTQQSSQSNLSSEKLFWRLTPAVCTLIVLLAIWISNLDVTTEYQMAELLIDNSIDLAYIDAIDPF